MNNRTNKPQTFFEGRKFIAKSNGQTAVWEVVHRENDKIYTAVVGIIPDSADVEKVVKGIAVNGICKVDATSKYYQTKQYTKRAIAFLCSKLIVRPVSVRVRCEAEVQLNLFGVA